MRYFSAHASAMIDRVLSAATDDFTLLVQAAGLDPKRDFTNALLRNVDFGGANLCGFNFSGTTFVSCRFNGAFVSEANFDAACFEGDDLHLAADFDAFSHAGPGEIGVAVAKRELPVGIDRALAMSSASTAPQDSADLAPMPEYFGEGPHWVIRCLCEVANIKALRYRLGAPFVDDLMFHIVDRIGGALPTLKIGITQSVIDITMRGDGPRSAEADIEQLKEVLVRPFERAGEKVQLELFLGAAAAPIDDLEEINLHQSAELALERARMQYRVVLIDMTRPDEVFARLGLVADLAQAIERNELTIHYQAKIHLRRRAIVAAEALIRWEHPTLGTIMPADFIPLAEENGQIEVLTLWMLHQAIADHEQLSGPSKELRIYINLSTELLNEDKFVLSICNMLSDGDAQKIGFEITETAVIRNPERTISNLRRLSDHGVRLAVDDYGAGLSSLAYLKNLPADELKIDRTFISQLASRTRDPLLVRSTIDLAHALDMEVTANGVESHAALDILSAMGCDMAQGFYISRPVGIDTFRKLNSDDHIRSVLHSEPARPSLGKRLWKSAESRSDPKV